MTPQRRDEVLKTYDLAPTFALEGDQVRSGWEGILLSAIENLTNSNVIAVEGNAGVPWTSIRRQITQTAKNMNRAIQVIATDDFLKPTAEIEQIVEPFTGGDDPIFGRLYPGEMKDFFVESDRQNIADRQQETIVILLGAGASLVSEENCLVYLDVPKRTIQPAIRNQRYESFVSGPEHSSAEKYKRAYYVEWPIFNMHKREILSRIDVFVDVQDPENPSFMDGRAFREGLDATSRNAFRVTPFFLPGPWGGQLIKENVQGLSQELDNYAWSYELITPENSIVFESGGELEFNFDALMSQAASEVLGDAFDRFGVNFPIRMNYLDTVDGGNLSIQCHPSAQYVQDQFGEPFTQNESYYIAYAEDGATVAHGFKNDADTDEFRRQLERSESAGTEVEVDRFVGRYPSKTGDLFLIPHGTIHSSGAGNLVLEISATPYLYTFKLYDWLQRDGEGNLRPINIARGWENLNFDRDEDYVTQNLHPEPSVINQGDDWKELAFPNHDSLFFQIHRYEMRADVHGTTANKCLVMNVVSGMGVKVTTHDRNVTFNQGETFVIPAAAGEFVLSPVGESEVQIVKAFVRDGMHG